MIVSLLTVGSRLAGRKDPRFVRGLLYALGEAVANGLSFTAMLLAVRSALRGTFDHRQLGWFSALALTGFVLRMLFARPAMENIFNAAHALMGHARIRMADHLRRVPMGLFTTRRSGELAGVLTTDIALVEDLWSHLFGLFAAGMILPMIVGVELCVLDWRLGLSMFLSLPLALGALHLTTPIFMRQMNEVLDATSDTNARLVEFVQGIAVLRSFGRHGEGYGRLRRSLERLRDALIRAEVAPAPLMSVYGFVVEASFVLVALAGSYLLLGGSLDPSTLLVFLVVSAGISRSVAELGVALLGLRAAQRAMQRIEALLAEPVLEEPARPASIERFDVELDHVRFAYEDELVLRDVHATLAERQLTAIVGPSGSGKSTLVHLIARLWDLESGCGTIRIGAVDLRQISFEDLHRHVALVFQDVVLFAGTVAENLRVAKPDASQEELVAAARAAQAHAFIEALPDGYETRLGDGGNTLSGGEKQRLSIARAILKDAPIVLLDEATASVDASAEAAIQAAIDQLVKHKTVVVIAHRLRTVQRAHRILVLERGALAESGSHEELLARDGVYARLWREQRRARGWQVTS